MWYPCAPLPALPNISTVAVRLQVRNAFPPAITEKVWGAVSSLVGCVYTFDFIMMTPQVSSHSAGQEREGAWGGSASLGVGWDAAPLLCQRPTVEDGAPAITEKPLRLVSTFPPKMTCVPRVGPLNSQKVEIDSLHFKSTPAAPSGTADTSHLWQLPASLTHSLLRDMPPPSASEQTTLLTRL